jgi:hypothetical protein
VNEEDFDELREELAALEAEETRVSTLRRHLHRQIDFGSGTAETRAREREVSDQRLALHRSIDVLRKQLGLAPGPLATVAERPDDESQGMSIGLERSFLNDSDDAEGHVIG